MSKRVWLPLLLLLAGAILRLYALTGIPPGMTHDEADHGLDAWGVVNGIRPIYFTVGYGREPAFDYSTAGLMAFLGPTYLAGRLTAVFFGLVLLAAVYAWVRRAFDRRVALLTLAALAFSFWSIMTARHALRSVTMPAVFTLAVAAYWAAVYYAPSGSDRRRTAVFALVGALLGASFYTYMPARIMWLLLPALWAYLWLTDRTRAQHARRGTLLTLLLAFVIAAPLFWFLMTTGAEQRLDQLSGPLTAARAGDWAPLLANVRGTLRLFTVTGDTLWRYNVPGRPFLTPVMGWLFYGGVALALWRALRPGAARATGAAHAVAVMWLIGGITPSLITGPEASVTRAIAMQPVLYLFPALAVDAVWRRIGAGGSAESAPTLHLSTTLMVTFFLLYTLAESVNAYFNEWANAPEVRVQYEHTLVTAVDYLNQHGSGPVALSSPAPDRFHDPSTALMTLRNDAVDLRWFNGLHSLLLPQDGPSTVVFSGWSALHPALTPFFAAAEPVTTLPLRESDANRPITIYQIDGPATVAALLDGPFTAVEPVAFGDHATLLGYAVLTPDAAAGGTLPLATLWRADRPLEGAVLFTHLLPAPDQPPLAQADRLDVPGYYWQPGDVFIQLHELTLPADLAAGRYTLAVGLYTRPAPDTFLRRPAVQAGTPLGDALLLTTVEVAR